VICQACGLEAPTKNVSFYQNIGLLVMRFHKSISGNLCKSCVHKYFWQFTLTNLVLGWWGIISFIVTPFFILNNVIRYILCLGMEPVPPGAQQARLTEEAVRKLEPHADSIIERLNQGEDFRRVAENTAMNAGVTPAQVLLYINALVQASRQQQQAK